MAKILLLSYSYEDDFAALSKGAATICQKLCDKKFTIGLEKLPLAAELDEQIEGVDTRIQQIKKLAHDAFQLSWDELIQEESKTLRTTSTKAVKPLIHRAKILAFQHAILNTLQQNDTIPFFGLGDKPDAYSIFDCLSANAVDLATIFLEKTHIIELSSTLKSLKVAVESFIFTTHHYALSEETAHDMQRAGIASLNVTKTSLPTSSAAFIQKICQSLNEQARLLVSMNAKKHHFHASHHTHLPPHTQPKEFITETEFVTNHPTSTSSLSSKMKETLRDFRGIFSDGEAGATTTTIVGNRDRNGDD